jgi:hypothetical protein
MAFIYLIRLKDSSLFPFGDVSHCASEVTPQHFLVKSVCVLFRGGVVLGVGQTSLEVSEVDLK